MAGRRGTPGRFRAGRSSDALPATCRRSLCGRMLLGWLIIYIVQLDEWTDHVHAKRELALMAQGELFIKCSHEGSSILEDVYEPGVTTSISQ